MFPKMINRWPIFQWTQLQLVIYTLSHAVIHSYRALYGGYICNFIDKDNTVAIFRGGKKCTGGIFSSTRDILPAIFQYSRTIFIAVFPLLLHSAFITWSELKFMVFLKINGRCNSIISNTQHRRVYRRDNNASPALLSPVWSKSFQRGSLSAEFALGY